ncbi:MAG TPA: PAS domain-containing protein, partial [Flavisolibacter sp.]|nr:PAS domain-containing protein [Flavisolibacter sp.]
MPYSNNPILPLLKKTDLLLFDSNPLPCFILDTRSLDICHLNSAAADQYPQVSSSETPQSFLSLFDRNSAIKLKQKIDTTGVGSSWSETIIEQQEGLPLIAIELSGTVVTLESKEYYLVICVDVSERQAEVLQLEAEKNKYQRYIEQSSEGIYCIEFSNPIPVDASAAMLLELFQKEGILSECNDAMARMYGFEKASDIIGISSSHLIDLTDENNITYLKSIVSNGFNITNAESHEKDNKGQSRYFLNNVVGIVEAGCLKRIWGTQRDITERKANEEKIKFLASLVEETSDVLTAADLDFNPITWNKASEKVYGLTKEQVIGKNMRSFIDLCYKGATREEIRKTICEQGEWKGEMTFIRPTDQKLITLLITFKLLKNDSGVSIGHVIAGTDITERIETEQRLSESESRFGHMADSAPVMIWMSDTKDKISYINQQMIDYTGIDKEDISFFSTSSIIHPDDHESSGSRYKQYFDKREPITLVYRLRNAAGDYRWVQDSSIPRLLTDGSFLGYVGCIIDIHDTKSKEEALRYQATILENVLDILVTTDLNLRIISWNKVAEEVYGYTESEALSKHFSEVIHIDLISSSTDQIKKSLKESGIWKGEVVYKNKEGEKRYFVHTVTHVFDDSGNKIGVMTVGRDITDRIHAERKLKQSEQFYRSLIADSHDGMLLMNAAGMITFASPSIKAILGFDPEEVTGKSGFEFVHPDDYGLAFQSFQLEVTVKTELKYLSVRLLKKEGGWVWCSVRGFNMLENPSVNSIVAYFHDDTLRKAATEALRSSELRFRNLIRDIQIGVILYDPTGKVIL